MGGYKPPFHMTDRITNLSVMGDETLSALEIMGLLGLSHRPTFRKNYLGSALEQGYVEMTIPDRPNS